MLPVTQATLRPSRLISLDVLRGLVIVLMIIVNSSGTPAYAWLQHAVWNGCTLADLVFPFFVVIVGLSSVLALNNLAIAGYTEKQLIIKSIKRSGYLFFLGLCINIFPNHFDLSHLRLLGVLQRVALCYFCSALLFIRTSLRTQLLICISLLLIYYCLLTGFSFDMPSRENNLVGLIDRWLLSPQHLYTAQFDPEGLFSTIPAIASALFGNIACCVLLHYCNQRERLLFLLKMGSVLAILGWFWSFIFPFNKSLWSSSYALWTGGWALLAFAVCFYLIEIKQWVRWAAPFLLFGKNAMLAYILHVAFLKVQALILIKQAAGGVVNLRVWLTHTLFGSFSPENASLCYALSYLLLWFVVLKLIEKIRIKRRFAK